MRPLNIKMKIIPKKSLGQNFLINQGILEKIVSAAELKKSDTVLEIGPGTGNLTKLLSEKAGRVIAIEKDHRLIEGLQEKFQNTNVEIIEADVLKLETETLIGNWKLETGNYKIVANIPYYITSNLLRTIFEKWSRSSDDRGSSTKSGPKPELIVLTVQKEVAQRILAKPPDMNLLALSVQLYSKPKIMSYISRGSFRPIPKVDSAIIKLTPKNETDIRENERVLSIAKKSFAGKRKQIQNTLPEINFESLEINPKSRPEELSLENWLKIASSL